MAHQAFICDAVRTPFGRYGGALSSVRTDDLGAIPIRALVARNPGVDWAAVADVIYGCANQAGEDNRNVARMAALLGGLPVDVTGTTMNRLCGSGMDAVGTAARAIKSGEAQLMIAGGVESMSRAPFVMMEHLTKSGESKIVEACSYPLTGVGCVSRIYTDMATIDITPQGLKVIDMVEGLTLDELQRLSGVPMQAA